MSKHVAATAACQPRCQGRRRRSASASTIVPGDTWRNSIGCSFSEQAFERVGCIVHQRGPKAKVQVAVLVGHRLRLVVIGGTAKF